MYELHFNVFTKSMSSMSLTHQFYYFFTQNAGWQFVEDFWQMSGHSAFSISFPSHLPWIDLVTALNHEEISFTSLRTQTSFRVWWRFHSQVLTSSGELQSFSECYLCCMLCYSGQHWPDFLLSKPKMLLKSLKPQTLLKQTLLRLIELAVA